MIGVIKSVRRVQVKQIAYCPNIFKAVITYEMHPTEYDESDDIEAQKELMEYWFKTRFNKKNT
tara:strand:- start:2976 stop:3164 length:189 start_codon:yes stop_codon:yes gene_type:complete